MSKIFPCQEGHQPWPLEPQVQSLMRRKNSKRQVNVVLIMIMIDWFIVVTPFPRKSLLDTWTAPYPACSWPPVQYHQRRTPWQDLHELLLDPPEVHSVQALRDHYHPYLLYVGREIWEEITKGAMERPCRQLDEESTKYWQEPTIFWIETFFGHPLFVHHCLRKV